MLVPLQTADVEARSYDTVGVGDERREGGEGEGRR